MSDTVITDTKPTKRLWEDGCEIALIRIAPRCPTATGDAEGRERSRYRVEVDGIVRGHIIYVQSWYGSWEARSLGALARDTDRETRLDSPFSVDGTPFQKPSRDDLARRFPGWITAGRAPSAEELATFRHRSEAERQDENRKTVEEAARQSANRARQREVVRTLDAARQIAEADRMATLQALRERAAPVLTNQEIDALDWAISALGTRGH